MNLNMKRLLFIFTCAGLVLRLLLPLLLAPQPSILSKLAFAPVPLSIALLVGLGISHTGRFFFNYTDFVRYTRPARDILAVVARYSSTAQMIAERGRAHVIARKIKIRSALALGAIVSVSMALALASDLTLRAPGSLITAPLGVASFLFGGLIGAIADILLPTSGLAGIVSTSLVPVAAPR